jgi:hypothetical protein
MEGYDWGAQIQTYASCTQDTFTDTLMRYHDALIRLGCTDTQVLDWLTSITWPTSDDDSFGDIYAAPVTLAPTGNEQITCAGIEVSLYAQSAIPTIEEPPSWVGFNLLFDTEQLKQEIIAPYSEEIGYTLWHILRTLASTFTELGAYLTDQWQENLTWRSLVENTGDPWVFELGIFPRSLSEHFKMVPAGFEGTLVDGSFGFAQSNRWVTLPWNK